MAACLIQFSIMIIGIGLTIVRANISEIMIFTLAANLSDTYVKKLINAPPKVVGFTGVPILAHTLIGWVETGR